MIRETAMTPFSLSAKQPKEPWNIFNTHARQARLKLLHLAMIVVEGERNWIKRVKALTEFPRFLTAPDISYSQFADAVKNVC